jgi:leucyl/phenylalanyl-tRNA--protein transferase
MVQAYARLNRAGLAHSVETWIDGDLVGGLYCVGLGGMVFGESMFSHQSNASKYALAALVAFCRASGITMIDCQQDTPHLASLGAQPIARDDFCCFLKSAIVLPSPKWEFQTVYWKQIID